jgi:predicted tellurium resistance membrane protein TerC
MLEHVLVYLSDPGIWVSFLTLTVLEIVLGIDNVIFIAIAANHLEGPTRLKARGIGLFFAFLLRVAFLASIIWITGHLTQPVFKLPQFDLFFSWRDIILFGGGAFLLVKATLEIHSEVEGGEVDEGPKRAAIFALVVLQIVVLDLVFSIDSILTAVGLSRELPVMIAAIFIAIIVMLVASGPVGEFIKRHPTVKMLALAFLLLVGVALIADGFGFHIPREYLYAAIAFSLFVEILNLMARRRRQAAPDDSG